jgi:hypothetical protein
MLAAARDFVDENKLARVNVMEDDLFASSVPESSFDLVHARFQIAPEQVRLRAPRETRRCRRPRRTVTLTPCACTRAP